VLYSIVKCHFDEDLGPLTVDVRHDTSPKGFHALRLDYMGTQGPCCQWQFVAVCRHRRCLKQDSASLQGCNHHICKRQAQTIRYNLLDCVLLSWLEFTETSALAFSVDSFCSPLSKADHSNGVRVLFAFCGRLLDPFILTHWEERLGLLIIDGSNLIIKPATLIN